MKNSLKRGITVPELVGIIAMIGVLCGSVVPHLLQTREASRLSKLRFNLKKLRKKIDDYRVRYGRPPAKLTDLKGASSEPDETPMLALPENPLSEAFEGERNRVKKIDSDPPLESDVTVSGVGGWLYNPETGGIWPDHPKFFSE